MAESDLFIESLATIDQRLLELIKTTRVEQGTQNHAAFLGLGQQKPLEPVLCQQNHLQKLVGLERQDGIELAPDGHEFRRDTPPVVAITPVQHCGG